MKYANLYWQNTDIAGGVARAINIGDIFQFLTIEYIYQEMGIEPEEITRLSVDELCTYKGEYVVLPLNWSVFDKGFMVGNRIGISPNIVPVYLAMTICSMHFKEEYFNEYNISYLKRYEPIGCRDEYTMNVLRQYGIEAYLNGCLTASLPKREISNLADKVFVVDAPVGIKKFMPEQIFNECEILTQQYYFDLNVSKNEIIDIVKKQYQRYAKEAKLVITSRLHVASPCMAMGIPVIFVKDKVDNRFGWLDTFLPLYDINSYSEINWEPEIVQYEEFKNTILSNALGRIKNTFEKYEKIYGISNFLEGNKTREYIDFIDAVFNNLDAAKKFLEKKHSKEDKFVYSIWGINSAAENFYEYMKETFPSAKLKDAIDTYKRGIFHGIQIIRPEDVSVEANEVVVVVAVKASNAAQQVFYEKGISQDQYVCSGDVFLKK